MNKIILAVALLLTVSGHVAGQTSYLSEIGIEKKLLYKTGDKMAALSFYFDITNLKLHAQHSLMLYPVLVSDDGSGEQAFPPVLINGSTRNKVAEREKRLDKKRKGEDCKAYPVYVAGKKNGKLIAYTASVPFRKWMIGSELQLRARVKGCAGCEEGDEVRYEGMVFPPKKTDFVLSLYVEPEKEIVKRRSENREARLQFRQGSYVIYPEMANNAEELNKVKESLMMVNGNADLTVRGIYVTGFASPEGSVSSNMLLSENRAKALMAYIRKEFPGVDRSLCHIEWQGEDWVLFRKKIAESQQLTESEREKILEITDNCTTDRDVCEMRFRATISPETYHYILNELYPQIRRNEYRVEYDVRHFDIIEGRKIIRERPDLMSVYEIHQVAESYGKDTDDYIECMLMGAKAYPDDVIMLQNTALALIRTGAYAKAVDILDKAPENPELLNLLGVAYARTAKQEKALDVLRKAMEKGGTNGKRNYEMLKEYMEYISE